MLTSVGSVSESQFRQQFNMMRSCPRSYYVTVVEDTKEGKVIGCATLQVEYKFIHEAGDFFTQCILSGLVLCYIVNTIKVYQNIIRISTQYNL